MTRSLRPLALVFALTLLASCKASDYTITLRNATLADLVPYPVVTDPPPPHREEDASGTLGPAEEGTVVPTGFNPVYFHAPSQRGFLIQIGLDDDPPVLLVRTFQYQVPPGDEGNDPALQPTLLDEKVFLPTKFDLRLVVGRASEGFPISFDES